MGQPVAADHREADEEAGEGGDQVIERVGQLTDVVFVREVRHRDGDDQQRHRDREETIAESEDPGELDAVAAVGPARCPSRPYFLRFLHFFFLADAARFLPFPFLHFFFLTGWAVGGAGETGGVETGGAWILTEPMSAPFPPLAVGTSMTSDGRVSSRWSVTASENPASMAGLPMLGGCVGVDPP